MAERSLVVRIIGDSSSLQRSFAQSSRGAKQFDRDFSRATRGVLAGSGVFRSLGRSLAFASGGFLAFGGAASFLRTSIDAAKEAQVANAQLATQLRNSGLSFEQYRSQIDKTIFRLSALAGIEDDELKGGLTTILRTVPDVSKALRDLGTAADLARAKHISLGAAATIIAKTEAGNTTLLRRQGFQIAKNATAEQALAKVRAVVAGQARAGTTEQERFGAVLHQTEEIIGTGILPTLNKYLESGSRWLEQMNESGKLQKDVADGADKFASAIGGAANVIKTIDKLTGSFKNTLELLLALKVGAIVAGWATSMNLFAASEVAASEAAVVTRINQYTQGIEATGAAAATSSAKVTALRSSLLRLGALVTVATVVEVVIHRKALDDFERKITSSFTKAQQGGFTDALAKTEAKIANLVPGVHVDWHSLTKAIDDQTKKDPPVLSPTFSVNPKFMDVSDQTLKQMFPAGLDQALKDALGQAGATTTAGGGSGGNGNAAQRNTFFDNAIARILLRGGLGNIGSQIAALQKADTLIEQRLKVTKDVTRRLNLEDQLLQNQAQIQSLTGQASADALQQREDAKQAALDKLQKRAEARAKALASLTSKQFRQLGLSATGDEVTPGVAGLKKRLGQLTANITGSSLDTPKLRTELARFRKVLSEGLVPKDVRAKIKQMMDDISDQLKQSPKQLTKFRHTNANALLAGLGLDAETTRILRQRLAQVGAGGTVPGTRSAAFSGAGTTTVIPLQINLDGKKIAQNTTQHQRRAGQRRSESRRGPYAGRH